MYRRYGWERAQWTRRKPFYEEFPSLSCLFRRAPQAGAGAGNAADSQQQHQQQQQLPAALPRNTKVNREDIVAALVRLRGGANASTGVGWQGGKGQQQQQQLLPPQGENARRRRVLLRAARKVAHCCQVAGVRTALTLAKTLGFFDFGPADERRRKEGRMRTVDMWHWLRLLSMPTDPSGGSGGGGGGGGASSFNNTRSINGGKRQAKGRRRSDDYGDCGGGGGSSNKAGGDRMVSDRLLDAEETSVILDAVECRSRVVGEEGGQAAAASALAAATEALEAGFFVSVPALWDLLVEHAPGLWDRDQEAREVEEVR